MSALPSFPTAPNGYDPARVDAFIRRLVDRSREEIASLRAKNERLEADLAEAFDVMNAADVRIRTLEMDLERVLEGFATGNPVDPSEHADSADVEPTEEISGDPLAETEAPPAQIEEPNTEDTAVPDEPAHASVPFTEPPPEVSAMEEKAAKAERAIRGRFLSSTKR